MNKPPPKSTTKPYLIPNLSQNQPEKLQKVLAGMGYGSRRGIEQWITAGRVIVNGQVATLGQRVVPEDRIRIDNKPLRKQSELPQILKVLIYHKPEGEICSRDDPDHPNTVFDHLPSLRQGRWISVGRLDINSAGLLLFTNDGELAEKLMHPRNKIEREYAVRVFGDVPDSVLATLKNGVELEDGPAKFDDIQFAGGEGSNRWYRVLLREGRNREVRRLWDSQGITVSRLIRVRYGPINLPPYLKQGKIHYLSPEEIALLLTHVDLKRQQQRPGTTRR
jgi:23S rRNA pseudouridine2605 synthase